MSDRPEFIEGATYTYEQIRDFTFPAKGSNGPRTPDMRFVYSRDPETGMGHFDEVIEPENPLIDSMAAQGDRGPSLQGLELPTPCGCQLRWCLALATAVRLGVILRAQVRMS